MKPPCALLVLIVLLGVVPGCGDDEPVFDPFAKQGAPTLPRRFHGKDLDGWLTVVDAADAGTRAEAAWALGELGADPDALAAVLGRLLDDPDPEVQLAALHALQQAGRVPATLSARVLELWGLDEARAWTRLDSLGDGFGDPDPARFVDHDEPSVTAYFLAWLDQGSPDEPARYIPAVLEMARSSRDEGHADVQALAWEVLPSLGEAGVDAAAEAFRASSEWSTTRATAAGLCKAGAVDAMRDLMRTAASQPAGGKLVTLLRAIPDIPASLRIALVDDTIALIARKGEIRNAAIGAVSAMETDARPALEAFLKSEAANQDAQVRQVVKLLLLRIRDD